MAHSQMLGLLPVAWLAQLVRAVDCWAEDHRVNPGWTKNRVLKQILGSYWLSVPPFESVSDGHVIGLVSFTDFHTLTQRERKMSHTLFTKKRNVVPGAAIILQYILGWHLADEFTTSPL